MSDQENFYDAVRNDPDMTPELKEKWLALESSDAAYARAVDHNPPGAAWRREGPARPVLYCACGFALPTAKAITNCENCGRPIV